uniref:Protein kinase domain-containing protein n=1 Tax=Daphnia galeata TaxID=27404 RepID=A0A8J2WPA4_9CRUS|nr:unnamed protein product [Daphnia galeata]
MAILKCSPIFHFRFSPKEELMEYHLQFLRRLRQRQRQKSIVLTIDILRLQFSCLLGYQRILNLQLFFRQWKKKGTGKECILFVTQRITNYPLLIDPLINTSREQTEECLKLQQVLGFVKILQDILIGVNAQVAEKECKLRLIKNRTKNSISSSKAGVISLQKLSVLEKTVGQNTRSIYLICSNPDEPEMYELQCQNPREKRIWIDTIGAAVAWRNVLHDNPSVSKLISINQGDVTRSENIQASWNTPSPAQPPNLSPQHGPINGILPRRDREASSASAMSNIPPIDDQKLSIATNHWNTVSILGKGGFSTVYKGSWKNTQVAVKRMENAWPVLFPMQQSMGELNILNAVRHDNILPLYGYSLGGDFPCLVYQFMPNGSLEDRLLCRQVPLLNLCLLLKVSRVLETRPYLPDEYLRVKKISSKVDAVDTYSYSYGIVLFELGTGLRAYDKSTPFFETK